MYSVCALTKFQGKIVFIDDKYLRLRSTNICFIAEELAKHSVVEYYNKPFSS